MLKKRNDFWEGVEEEKVVSVDAPEEAKTKEIEDDWSIFKSTPIKVIMRIILMFAFFVALISGYIAYKYVSDRYVGGNYSDDYFDSQSFAEQYDKSIEQLIGLVRAIEADPEVINDGNEELLTTMVENYMGKESNFSFLIQDEEHFAIASSGDDAKDRIESSSHFALITDVDEEVTVSTSVVGDMPGQETWKQELADTEQKYIIYTAVDDELTSPDAFYYSRVSFNQYAEYFSIAKIAGIAALVIFFISLIFCIVATGRKRGCKGIHLSLFDRIFTELALVIMFGVAGVIAYVAYTVFKMDGNIYTYAAAGFCVLLYIWVARSYFSIVRRIKAGRLFRCSIVGFIVRCIGIVVGKLPSPLNIIIDAILLIFLNAGIVCFAFMYRTLDITTILPEKVLSFIPVSIISGDIPVSYILGGIAVFVEIIGFLSYATGSLYPKAEDMEEAEGAADAEVSVFDELKEEKAAASQTAAEPVREPSPVMVEPEFEEEPEWENMDLGSAIQNTELENKQKEKEERIYATDEAAIDKTRAAHIKELKTQVISPQEMEAALRSSGVMHEMPAAENEGRVNFVQLNKDIRKTYRHGLKQRGIVVSMRIPEKPIIVDIDEASLAKVVNSIFGQIERLSADNVKNYLEVYTQKNKVVYMAKINVSEDMLDAAASAASDGSFDEARRIVESNGGRFAATLEENILKVGMLIDA